MLETTQNT